MSRSAILVLAGLVPALGLPPGAKACSCVRVDAGFLIEPGTELPANARGVPWSGWLEWDGTTTLPPGKDFFAVERLDGPEAGDVVFDLELLGGDLLRDDDVLALVAPREGFEPGGRYRFSFRRPSFRTAADELPARYRLEVSVGREPLVAGSSGESAGSLAVWKTARDQLEVETRAGSCSVRVDAAQTGVELELPDELARWRDALLYVTRVDGEIYRPASTYCGQTAPGRSWTGMARELLFADCEAQSRVWGRPEGVLPEGVHLVEMTAWLPGTEQTFEARRDVRLSCGGGAEERTREALGDPIWGLEPGRELELIEKADLVLADGTRLAVTVHGADEPRPTRRLIVWRDDSDGIFTRLYVADASRLEFDALERHGELFLLVRQLFPESRPGNTRSAMVIHLLEPDRLVPIKVERGGPCGHYLPELDLDGHATAEPGYLISSAGITFGVEAREDGLVAGVAEIVERDDGYALAAVSCR